ncbi:MltA-interacting MipA [Anopheles sinensis]|uniref:MltA-interacting MipA n=1 Tax=Anopheles sinensis TaxID=74873 RepID=A0A084VK92_ANOSI|nr:MltA-interacting MipA [Anopheles sinensis]
MRLIAGSGVEHRAQPWHPGVGTPVTSGRAGCIITNPVTHLTLSDVASSQDGQTDTFLRSSISGVEGNELVGHRLEGTFGPIVTGLEGCLGGGEEKVKMETQIWTTVLNTSSISAKERNERERRFISTDTQ